uniref:Transformer female-specific splice variant n=1 Tax=Leptopilina clavipes TaxID=63434 RepID=A0A345VNP4_9HYME|nr:transformer female-specific splice variant [Leptopilina clavipes]
MRRRSPSASSRDRRSRRSRSEDRRTSDRRVEGEIDKRREAWLIQQQRARDHEILKQKMILEYELRRAILLKKTEKSSRRSRSTSRSKDRTKSIPKPAIMSEKFEAPGGSEPLFRGPSTSSRPTDAELRQIKVDIHRNISGPVDVNNDLQREIVNPEDVRVKRREGEGITPIFDRVELRPLDKSKFPEEGEHREVKTVNFEKSRKENHLLKRRSRSLSSLEERNKSPRDTSLSRRDRRERSVHNSSRKNQRRSKSSDSSDDDCYGRYRKNGRNDGSKDRSRPSSSHHHDRSNHSSRRPSSRERSRSVDRRREDLGRLTRIESARDYRGRSRERRESYRQIERENSEGRRREMPSYPHYVEHIPVPVYYGNFPRPVMMGPMMPMRGPPPMRNRPPFGARFPPRYMNPRFPPNPRFSRQF